MSGRLASSPRKRSGPLVSIDTFSSSKQNKIPFFARALHKINALVVSPKGPRQFHGRKMGHYATSILEKASSAGAAEDIGAAVSQGTFLADDLSLPDANHPMLKATLEREWKRPQEDTSPHLEQTCALLAPAAWQVDLIDRAGSPMVPVPAVLAGRDALASAAAAAVQAKLHFDMPRIVERVHKMVSDEKSYDKNISDHDIADGKGSRANFFHVKASSANGFDNKCFYERIANKNTYDGSAADQNKAGTEVSNKSLDEHSSQKHVLNLVTQEMLEVTQRNIKKVRLDFCKAFNLIPSPSDEELDLRQSEAAGIASRERRGYRPTVNDDPSPKYTEFGNDCCLIRAPYGNFSPIASSTVLPPAYYRNMQSRFSSTTPSALNSSLPIPPTEYKSTLESDPQPNDGPQSARQPQGMVPSREGNCTPPGAPLKSAVWAFSTEEAYDISETESSPASLPKGTDVLTTLSDIPALRKAPPKVTILRERSPLQQLERDLHKKVRLGTVRGRRMLEESQQRRLDERERAATETGWKHEMLKVRAEVKKAEEEARADRVGHHIESGADDSLGGDERVIGGHTVGGEGGFF